MLLRYKNKERNIIKKESFKKVEKISENKLIYTIFGYGDKR